jgi:hypothetical protein
MWPRAADPLCAASLRLLLSEKVNEGSMEPPGSPHGSKKCVFTAALKHSHAL